MFIIFGFIVYSLMCDFKLCQMLLLSTNVSTSITLQGLPLVNSAVMLKRIAVLIVHKYLHVDYTNSFLS